MGHDRTIGRRVSQQQVRGCNLELLITKISKRSAADLFYHDCRPVLNALILGLLWLRILAFLKVVNEQLATFIIALAKVSR